MREQGSCKNRPELIERRGAGIKNRPETDKRKGARNNRPNTEVIRGTGRKIDKKRTREEEQLGRKTREL
jgi:hypothetical protein